MPRRPARLAVTPLEDRLTPTYVVAAAPTVALLDPADPTVQVLNLDTGANPNDDATATIDLGGSVLSYYSTTIGGAGRVTVSSNGLVTFDGSQPNDFAPKDLTLAPNAAAVAPLWQDWFTATGGPMVLYKVANDTLSVEWYQVKSNNVFSGALPVSFQADFALNTGTTRGR